MFSPFRLLLVVPLLVLASSGCARSPVSARAATSLPLRTQLLGPAALSVSVQPLQIKIGRDVALHITVRAGGRPVAAEISVTGAGRLVLGRAVHGSLTVTVHASVLGSATVLASLGGYVPAVRQIPIVPGSLATVMAVQRGIFIQPPGAVLRRGFVGSDLFAGYHARTNSTQLASLGLQDGSLVDLRGNTDLRIQDPLHLVLAGGELFLQMAPGAAAHLLQAGIPLAVSGGTRLDVRYSPLSRTTIVTVVEGLVQVSNRGSTQLVGSGQVAVVVAGHQPSVPGPVYLPAVVGWVLALPNSTPTVIPPILAVPPPPPLLLPAAPVPPAPNLTLTGTLVTTNVTGVVLITGTAVLPAGATLTVAPGTLIEFGPNALLQVDGTFRAAGTAAAPITFTSSARHPQPGDWQTVRIESQSASASIIDHVHAFYGGGDGYYGTPGMVLVRAGANITIANSVFAHDAHGAIYVDDSSHAAITNCAFADDAGTPVNVPVNLLGQVTGIRIAPGQTPVMPRPGAITTSATWLPMPEPPIITGTVTLVAGVTLTIAAGTTLQFGPGALLQVDGVLHAVGTASAPITFTSAAAQAKPGDWQDLRIEGAPAGQSVLDHVQFFYGGSDGYYGTGGALLIRAGANIQVRNSTFAQGSSGAIYVDDATRPTITDCLFAGDPGSPINAPVDGLAHFTRLHFAAGQTPIVARPGAISTSATWLPSELPEVITGTVTLPAGTRLTLAPGTVLAMGPNALIQVDGILKALGTPAAPIAFTSVAAQPSPGDWQVIRIEGSIASGTVLNYVQVLGGGHDSYYGVPGMVLVRAGASIAIAQSTFAGGSNGGIYVDTSSLPSIVANSFTGVANAAILVPAADEPKVRGNTFGPAQMQVQVHT